MSRAGATAAIETRLKGGRVDWQKIERPVDGAHHDVDLFTMCERLRDLKTAIGGVGSAPSNRFEAEGSAIVHSHLSKLPPEFFSNREFWIWLSVRHLFDIVQWRHASSDASASQANFGLASLNEGLLYRMYARGDIAYDANTPDDPYWLARRGSQDFWRSHIFRRLIGGCRLLTHALVEELYPDESGKSRVSNNVVRDLAKKLQQLYATHAFEVLTVRECRDLICSELGETK